MPGLLRYPSISAKQIAFVYANKLWVVGREGGQAVPLATPPGSVRQPRFSPDGAQVAFTGNYDGNFDLYTIPVEGGLPTRATHHPAAERLCNWTPDGKLLFASNGLTGQARQDQLFYRVPEWRHARETARTLWRRCSPQPGRTFFSRTHPRLPTIAPGNAIGAGGRRTSGCSICKPKRPKRLRIGKARILSRCGREAASTTCRMAGRNTA